MIELRRVTKVFGQTVAVNGLSAVIHPGTVTGFLGPNGAGKSTTMRMIAGLNRPTSGEIFVNGRRLADSPAPLREIGAVLDSRAMQPNRSARSHMRVVAATHGIPDARVDEMLSVAGLSAVAGRPISTYSLGMVQRLSIAVALLADPAVLIFDEPINGLDPEGVAWVRFLLRQQAAAGKTVLVSSHLMSEMEHSADHLLIVGRGHLLVDVPMSDFIQAASGVASRVTSPNIDAIVAAFAGPNVQAVPLAPGTVELRGVAVQQVAELAAKNQWVVYQLAPVEVSLEDAYLRLTASAVDFVSGGSTVSAAYAAEGPAWRPGGAGAVVQPQSPYQPPPVPTWQTPAAPPDQAPVAFLPPSNGGPLQ